MPKNSNTKILNMDLLIFNYRIKFMKFITLFLGIIVTLMQIINIYSFKNSFSLVFKTLLNLKMTLSLIFFLFL